MHQVLREPWFFSAADDKAHVGGEALTHRQALSQFRAPQVLLSFDAEPLFVSQNDLMPNQGVSRILITLLEVRYLCERAQTVIRASTGKKSQCLGGPWIHH